MERPQQDRYRKWRCRKWFDSRVRRLSKQKPSGQGLYFYLETGPATSNIPGLYRAGEAQLAEELEWSIADFRRCFEEIRAQGLADADWAARVVFLPTVIDDDPPSNVNVVTSWRATLDEIPECALKTRAIVHLREHLAQLGDQYQAAFEAVDQQTSERRRQPDEATRTAVKLRDGEQCRYCRIQVKPTDRRGPAGAVLDLVDPTGPLSVGNLVVCCRGCQTMKGRRTPAAAGMELSPEPNHAQVQLRFGSRSDLDRIKPEPGTPDPDPRSINQNQKGNLAGLPDPDLGTEPGGYDLQRAFGVLRANIIGGFTWTTPGDPRGEIASFAARLDNEAVQDVVPTMRLALERIRDEHADWKDPRLKDPSFAFGAWKAKFTSLREEMHHAKYTAPRNGASRAATYFNPAAETR